MLFVDLDVTPPMVRGSVEPSIAGFKFFACPTWGDDDTALAFTESDGTTVDTFVMRWKSSSPETPTQVGSNVGTVLAVMYR